MPQVAAIAMRTIPHSMINLVPGADDVSDVQTIIDIARIGRELGWMPRLGLARGLQAYRREIEAGRAAFL
jgi:UDP-glucuronate 4-epimerase